MTSLEQHLANHEYLDTFDGWESCECGWREEIERRSETGSVFTHAAHVADAWRESRTVRTVEELDALPEDAVIQYGPIILQKLHGHPTYGDGWFKPGDRMPWLMPIRDSDIDGPIIILWKPDGWGWGRESQDGAR